MKFVYNDGGRAADGWKGKTGDCVTRALAIAMNVPYAVIYQDMADGCATQRASKRTAKRARTAREGVNTNRKWFKDYMAARGWKWTPTMSIGAGCTVHLDPAELPAGRIIVALSKHYAAVIDGVTHDTYDCSRGGKRCVYGYWSRA